MASFLLMILTHISPALACAVDLCRCAPLPSPVEAQSRSSTVFVGEVLSISDSSWTTTGATSADTAWRTIAVRSRLVRLRLVRTLKGSLDATPAVFAGPGNCAFPFELGRQYLVYATSDSGRLHTTSCSRTRPLDRAGEDLAALAPLGP